MMDCKDKKVVYFMSLQALSWEKLNLSCINLQRSFRKEEEVESGDIANKKQSHTSRILKWFSALDEYVEWVKNMI